jgi:predicted PurR-regulated permease PerM
VVNGVIGTAAAQAILAWIGFTIAGVPAALLLGVLTFGCSLIMFPPLIWGPAVAWLFWQGEVGMGVFLLIWGFFVISGVDNILKPYLISRGGNLPLVVVLLGVFGGILAFGFMGLFLGPTLLAVAYSLLSDWVGSPVGSVVTSAAEPADKVLHRGDEQARNAPSGMACWASLRSTPTLPIACRT